MAGQFDEHRPPRQTACVRAVGELLENQYRIGLVRMERAIKERMRLQEIGRSCRTT